METRTDQRQLRPMHPRLREMLFTAKRFLRNPLSVIGLSLIVIFGVIAILAPVLEPPTNRDPYKIPHNGYRIEPSPPSAAHPLGTTQQQYDMLYGLVWGARSAFKIGVSPFGSFAFASAPASSKARTGSDPSPRCVA